MNIVCLILNYLTFCFLFCFSFEVTKMFPNLMDKVDIISDAETIKILLKLTHSKNSVIFFIIFLFNMYTKKLIYLNYSFFACCLNYWKKY